ncbi:MAG: glucosaminidase domain-containing protein [Gammaproteobacteria bacterium]|nr:glucosaminidase domain-containing protein [Gammaproteobacteria bacterium]
MKKHSIALLGLGLLTLVLVTAIVVAAQTSAHALSSPLTPMAIHTKDVSADTVRALDSVFKNIGYNWPPGGQQSIPPLMLAELPDDFDKIRDVDERRELFLRVLLPIVLIENQRLREQRELAAWLLESGLPADGSLTRDWLNELAKQLRVRGDLNEPSVREKILLRLDEIPPALALAQAAIETGWGSSRFALEGNSLFGQWTFGKTGGLTPNSRDADATHLVASFPDLRASVRAYMRNLNTGNAYHEFRTARAAIHAAGKPLGAYELAGYLHRYSARGEDYITEIRRIIRSPAISALAEASLAYGTKVLEGNERSEKLDHHG